MTGKIVKDPEYSTSDISVTSGFCKLTRYGRLRALEFDCDAASLNEKALGSADVHSTDCFNTLLSYVSGYTNFINGMIMIISAQGKFLVRYIGAYNSGSWDAPAAAAGRMIRVSLVWIV